MTLTHSAPFDPTEAEGYLASLPRAPAVFALWPEIDPAPDVQPYLGRTRNLRHRLERLLGSPQSGSRRLNLREFARRVDYRPVGSSFEAAWLIYQLNRAHYPRVYRQRLRLKPPALLKVNLSNRFPRCYPTRRLARDGSLYYGPFPSRAEAERFAAEFLDFFKIRRCSEELHPDPAHPGCIYSQMRMCLAPCFAGCTGDEYQHELGRAVGFLNSEGITLVGEIEAERGRASEALDFEEAARAHHRLDKVNEVLRRRPALVRNIADLHAIIVEHGAEARSAVLFRIRAGELLGPASISLDESVATPAPLDQQLQNALGSLEPPQREASRRDSRPESEEHGGAVAPVTPPTPLPNAGRPAASPGSLPPWEHLAILARWYYSSFREGEFVLLNRAGDIPHARLVRICRKVTKV